MDSMAESRSFYSGMRPVTKGEFWGVVESVCFVRGGVNCIDHNGYLDIKGNPIGYWEQYEYNGPIGYHLHERFLPKNIESARTLNLINGLFNSYE